MSRGVSEVDVDCLGVSDVENTVWLGRETSPNLTSRSLQVSPQPAHGGIFYHISGTGKVLSTLNTHYTVFLTYHSDKSFGQNGEIKEKKWL